MSTMTRRPMLVPAIPWRPIVLLLIVLALTVSAMVLTIGSGPDDRPAPAFGPAANGALAYALDGDVYVRDTPTAEPRLLIGGSELDVYTLFSPDGRTLAFVRLSEGAPTTETVMVAKPDGTDARAVIGADVIHSFAWSPDSNRFAVITETDGQRELSLHSTRGGEFVTLDLQVTPVAEVFWMPPVGDELLFLGRGGTPPQFAIYRVKTDGTGLRAVSAPDVESAFMGPFALSPDGGELAITAGGSPVQIRLLDLRTGEARVWGEHLPALPEGRSVEHWGFPSYSADGSRFVFGRYWDDTGESINHQVWVASVDSDGADAVAVAEVHRSRSGHNPFAYAFAPDDTKLLIQTNDTGETWLVDPDGGQRQLLGWGEVIDPPSWQRLAP